MKNRFSLAAKVLIPICLATLSGTAYAAKFEFGTLMGDIQHEGDQARLSSARLRQPAEVRIRRPRSKR